MASSSAIECLPPDILAKVLSRVGTVREVAQAICVSKQFREASHYVQELRFWYSTDSDDLAAGALNMHKASWLGQVAHDHISQLVKRSQSCRSMEVFVSDDLSIRDQASAKWTGFQPDIVLKWLQQVRPTLEVLHLDNLLLTPVDELPSETKEEGSSEGSGSGSLAGSRLKAIVKMVVRGGMGAGKLRRAGGSGDFAASKNFPRLHKAGGSVDLSHSGSLWKRPGEGDSDYASTDGSPARSVQSGSSGEPSPIHPSSPTSTGGTCSKGKECQADSCTPRNSPPRVQLSTLSGFTSKRADQSAADFHNTTPNQLSLCDVLAELEGGVIQRIFVSHVSVLPAVAPFCLQSLRVLHISKPLAAPSSAALNSILSGCCHLSQLYLSDMDGFNISTTSYTLSSDSLRVFCVNRAKMGALKLRMPKLEILDLGQVHPLVVVVLQEGNCLETIRVRDCGSADHHEDLFILGATGLRELEIDATSIGYFNAGLNLVRTAGDSLRTLAVNVVPPVLPANIFEMAMEMPDLRFLSIGRDLWDAILRGKGEVWWTHFAWSRLVELQIDFGTPQFSALNLLHDFVTRCSGLQRLVLRCASRDAHAWLQAPMHEFLAVSKREVDLAVDLLGKEDCFSLEARAQAPETLGSRV